MPAIQPNELVVAISNAAISAGYSAQLCSPLRHQPRRFLITGPNTSFFVMVYAWTLTFGGRASLKNEFRIQMTSVTSPLDISKDGPTVLIGYEPDLNLFAGFDLVRHKTFTAGSPSVQIDREALRKAELDGISFHKKSNDEIAVGIRPDMLIGYILNAQALHKFGHDGNTLKLLNQAVHVTPAVNDLTVLSTERQRIIREVSSLSREAGFRQRVLYAYGNQCAITRVQLRLVDAAHILPVGAPGSADHVSNGIALAPTYHRAFDAGLIYLDEKYRMRLNPARVKALEHLHLVGGIKTFQTPLDQPIFLPPDPQQRPSADFIRKANRFRQI